MANQKNEKKQNGNTPSIDTSAWKKQSSDVAGYWDGTGILLCIPRGAKIFDSNLESNKPSTLILVELLAPATINVKEGDKMVAGFPGVKGDLIGVWYKPGMKSIINLSDAPVSLQQVGEKDIGKPSPMKLYEVKSPGPHKKLMVIEDAREESAHAKTAFAKDKPQAPINLDDIPF